MTLSYTTFGKLKVFKGLQNYSENSDDPGLEGASESSHCKNDSEESVHNENESIQTFKTQTPNKKQLGVILRELLICSNVTPVGQISVYASKCYYCRKKFPKPADLKQHSLFDHEDMLKERYANSMERHLSYVKLDVTSPHCKICGGDFATLKELIKHLNYNHGKKITEDMLKEVMPFKFDGEEMSCYICSTVAYSFTELVKHMVVHYNKYYCKECDLNFHGIYALKQHEIVQHSNSTVTEMIPKRKRRKVDKIDCVHCGIELKSRGALRTHLAKDHNVKQVIPCKACEKTFSTVHTLNMHVRNFHLMERNFKCTECNDSFSEKSSLNIHKRKHAKA